MNQLSGPIKMYGSKNGIDGVSRNVIQHNPRDLWALPIWLSADRFANFES